MWHEFVLALSAVPFLLGALRFLLLFLGLRLTLRKTRPADRPGVFRDFAGALSGGPPQMGGGSKSQFILSRATRARRASG
ncbi:hypothetical protein SAMN05421869_11755 [Nonomuraea jiangxiensis]|uniref:Uncharacterized protein n=1 Tax=Nonomuraea jiangxiensis TaxID=633440 RepID=A0A1G9D9S1_9ACTN|nr:hypothetical protein SAMN05421869_11755 [Nonomuraea jiangxiensis]